MLQSARWRQGLVQVQKVQRVKLRDRGAGAVK